MDGRAGCADEITLVFMWSFQSYVFLYLLLGYIFFIEIMISIKLRLNTLTNSHTCVHSLHTRFDKAKKHWWIKRGNTRWSCSLIFINRILVTVPIWRVILKSLVACYRVIKIRYTIHLIIFGDRINRVTNPRLWQNRWFFSNLNGVCLMRFLYTVAGSVPALI
jgi:hypothetical protein